MVYSLQLLDCLAAVPHFKEIVKARQFINLYLEENCSCCRYPIFPMGNYCLDPESRSLMEKIQSYSIPIINSFGYIYFIEKLDV